MRSLYLLRHGETLFNVQHKTQGWCDSPLTQRGIEQARLAGRMLADRGLSFDRFFSSTSERCCDTLELAVEAGWGFVPTYERCKGLKEMNFGAFEAKDQFLERFPHDDFYVAFGGESTDMAVDRLARAIDDIMGRGTRDGECVLATSHGGVGINLFHAVVADPKPGTVPFGNCICYHYEYDEQRAGQGVGALSWVETLAPDFSALQGPDEPPLITWR